MKFILHCLLVLSFITLQNTFLFWLDASNKSYYNVYYKRKIQTVPLSICLCVFTEGKREPKQHGTRKKVVLQCTLKNESLNELGDSLVMVLQRKFLVHSGLFHLKSSGGKVISLFLE